MIKLPEPAVLGPQGTGTYFHSYTEAQLKQFARDVLAEAAFACDAIQQDLIESGGNDFGASNCASDIREMIVNI